MNPVWENALLFLLVRREYRGHTPPFHLGRLIDPCQVLHIFNETTKQIHSLILVDNVSASKLHVRLYLVTIVQEITGVVLFELIIVIVGAWSEPKLLHLHRLRPLPLPLLLLLLLVAVLAVVNDLAYGRLGIRSNFNEIKVMVAGAIQGVFEIHDLVIAFWFNDAYSAGADLSVYANFISFSDSKSGGLLRNISTIR